MNKIKATFRSCRGVADCDRCREDPGNVRLVASYKDQTDTEEAEKLLYEDMFQEEMDMQNEAYRKKGNYGRIWTMDEWRRSVRHRPLESVVKVGSKKIYLLPKTLLESYHCFNRWRNEGYGDIFELVSAVIYTGKVSHIHERYVLYWTDENGVRHTGIDKALEQAGIGLPFPKREESRYNNRKMMFDRICREKWLDFIEGVSRSYPDVELERPDPEFKLRIGINRECRLEFGHYLALNNARSRYERKADVLGDRIADLQKEQEGILSEMEYGGGTADEMAALRERLLVVKGKIKRYEEQIEKTKGKLDPIYHTIENF